MDDDVIGDDVESFIDSSEEWYFESADGVDDGNTSTFTSFGAGDDVVGDVAVDDVVPFEVASCLGLLYASARDMVGGMLKL